MKKSLIVLIALLLVAFFVKSQADMKITPEGVTFPNASMQTMAAAPPWSQKLPDSERFELVLPVIVVVDGKKEIIYPAVLDKETGLVWERTGSSSTMDWESAIDYCYQRPTGGRMGWRLPTIEELSSLVDTSKEDPALPDGNPFLGNLSSEYWSSTTVTNGTATSAWGVHFYDGYVLRIGKISGLYVRAVRGAHGYDAR
jgi:hypothetical protein